MSRFLGSLLAVFVVFSVRADAHLSECQQHHCVMIVDAGSTGSRLHLYLYDLDAQEQPIQIKEIQSNKITPGFAMLELDQSVVDNYLTRLFSVFQEPNIPVYFYATGGMRLLSATLQQSKFELLHHWFDAQSQFPLSEAKTISGYEESVYGWLAVNYQTGSLISSEKPFVGVMDMGGASVQIAFPVRQTNNINSNDLVKLDIYGREVKLFVHSFLGLGLTEVSHQFLQRPECFPEGYPLPDGGYGKGNAEKCQHDISKLVQFIHKVKPLVHSVLQANEPSEWHASSGLSSMAKSAPFVFPTNMFTSKSLLEQAEEKICHRSWQDVQSELLDNDYLYLDCLAASYYYALLVNGYGLSPEEVIHVLPNDLSGDWTLGVVVLGEHQNKKLFRTRSLFPHP